METQTSLNLKKITEPGKAGIYAKTEFMNPSGSIKDRMVKHVIEQADFLVDLHCGDGNEALRPYAYWMQTGDEKLDAASKG
ncbi:MAG: hypothetical protein ACERKS_08825, partial [Candidatus Bathyarchaeota archaeon]